MKGLLRKDFYVIRGNLLPIGVMFVIVGSSIAFLTSPWVLAILGTIMFGSVSASTIISDKSAQWDRFSATLPLSRLTVVSSKYALYGLLSLLGLLLGTLMAILACLILGDWDRELMWFQISLGTTVALVSGSISIPCGMRFSEEKATVAMMLSYAITAMVFAGIVIVPKVFFQMELSLFWTGLLGDLIGAAAFCVSWRCAGRYVPLVS